MELLHLCWAACHTLTSPLTVRVPLHPAGGEVKVTALQAQILSAEQVPAQVQSAANTMDCPERGGEPKRLYANYNYINKLPCN